MRSDSNDWAEDFSYRYLAALLEVVAERFLALPLQRAEEGLARRGAVFLRHDIDLDLEAALPIAELEQAMGISATYLAMTSSPTYDVSSRSSEVFISKILELGHEVGLHSNPPARLRASSHPDLGRFVEAEAQVVEGVVGLPVESVSFHRPVDSMLRGPLQVTGRVNAYAAPLMEEYISDSAGRWRVGDPNTAVRRSRATHMQILIHPIWWGEHHEPGTERLQGLYERLTSGLEADAARELDAALADHLTIKRSGAAERV